MKYDKSNNETLIIYLDKEIDENYSQQNRDYIDELIETNYTKNIIFDFTDTNFMDSTGIGFLIGRYKKMKKQNISGYICNPNKHLEKLLTLSGIYQLMPKINNN